MSVDVEKSLEVNSDILMAEMIDFQETKWENNRICTCDASYPADCECDLEKDQLIRWKRRTNRETSEKFGAKAMQILHEKTKRGMWHDK